MFPYCANGVLDFLRVRHIWICFFYKGKRTLRNTFLLHFRPRRIPAAALRFRLTWGLGGMAALMVVQQLATGILLLFYYDPLPVQAYQSVQQIQDTLLLGRLVRNLHHWTGHALVVVVFLHLFRIVINGALYPPRRMNWLVGLCLGLLILAANFSGYLLPWDQLSFWAVTIATSMLSYIPGIGSFLQEMVRGGQEIGASTLRLFYVLHTTLVPCFLFLLMAYHFWLVRKAGGVFTAEKEVASGAVQHQTVPVIPELLVREVAFAVLVSCVLLLFSMLVDAPLGDMANPQLTPVNVKAPWYFLGAQELLLHVPPVVAVCVVPLAIAAFLFFLPFSKNKSGPPSRLLMAVFIIGVIFMLAMTMTGIWFRGPAMQWVWPW